MRRAALGYTVLVGALLLMSPAAAGVDAEDGDEERMWRGVAIDLGRIDVADVLQPGQTYALATITVRNPGTVASNYRMGVHAVETAVGNPDATWIHFDPETFHLEPSERVRVEVTINVPRGSQPGAYETLLTAQLASDAEGPAVGGAAAARLLFTVAPSPTLPAIDPLFLLFAAVAVAIALVVRLARRYTFRIERRSG